MAVMTLNSCILRLKIWICLIWAIFIAVKGSMSFDPCEGGSTEIHLHDMTRRFQEYKANFDGGEEMVCDKYMIPSHGAWFMVYNDMLTKPPTFLDCGTTHPIWLNGTLPESSDGIVNRTACKVGFMSYCDEQIPVKIKRCERYTAYFLLPTKHCPEAYCFGQVGDPVLPKPVVKPKLGTFSNANGFMIERLEFECYMDISNLNFAYYEVKWIWGDNGDTLSKRNDSTQFSNLTLTDEHFNVLGTDVACTVTAFHYEHDTIGRNSTSDKFFAGLKVTELVTITKGGTTDISYKLTVPFGCPTKERCSINIQVAQTGLKTQEACSGKLTTLSTEGNNTITILNDKWNDTHAMKLKHIGRKGYGVYPSNFILDLEVDVSKSNFRLHKKLPRVRVNVEDSPWDHKVCSAQNDPHMTTFDGLVYEHQQPGTYILYEHTIIERHMQVQIELTPCNSNIAYCICGLAVRAGGDVYVIYLCGGQSILRYASCRDRILQVKRAEQNTKQYKIMFPTGTEISVNIFLYGGYDGTMNVEIRGTGDDLDQSQGLCGKMNGKCQDDLLHRDGTVETITPCTSWQKYIPFSDSWKVNSSENLFHLLETETIEEWNDLSFSPHHNDQFGCNSDQGFQIVAPISCNRTKTLNIPTMPPTTVMSTPTPHEVDWNETKAQKFCNEKITETNVFKQCSDVKDIDWKHFYEMCWHDILLTDSTLWARQTADSLINKCKGEVILTNNDTSILLHLCPENCSNRGICENGSCICYNDYIGVDCSVSITSPPMITGINGMEFGGRKWCDKFYTNCLVLIVFGHEIEHSGDITCSITINFFYVNATSISMSSYTAHGTVESLSEIHCILPYYESHNHLSGLYVEQFRVMISYNKNNYSSPMELFVFDSNCYEINKQSSNPAFFLKNNTCFINGTCTDLGTKNLLNEYFICDPENNQLNWTFDYKNNCKIGDLFYHKSDENHTHSCLVCDPSVSSTNWTVKGGCFIESKCFPNWSHNPYNDIYICNSSFSITDWSFNDTKPVPEVKVHLVEYYNIERLEFECFLDTSRMNYTYFRVIWKWSENNSQIYLNTSDNLSLMRLTENYLHRLGIKISCSIEGLYDINKVVTTYTSDQFYAGIQTDKVVHIEKGETANVKYRLTVPLTCQNNTPCRVFLNITDVIYQGDTDTECIGDIVLLSNNKTCEIVIEKDEWNISKSFLIKHRASRQYGVDPHNFLLKITAVVFDRTIWSTFPLEIEVHIVQEKPEWSSKVCSAYNDPHMTTFDGLHYEHQYSGKYTLYHNKIEQRHMEVQVQFTACSDAQVFCTCGVAIRAGADVFVINFCNGLSVIQYVSCEHAPVLRVLKQKKNNQHYRIAFPTGTTVDVNIYHFTPVNLLDVEIRPSADDFNNTEGLCGTLTGSCRDDFELRKNKSYLTNNSCNNRFMVLRMRNFRYHGTLDKDLFNINNQSRLNIWENSNEYCKFTQDATSCSKSCSRLLYTSIDCVDDGFEPIKTTCRDNVLPGRYNKNIPSKTDNLTVMSKPTGSHSLVMNFSEALLHCQMKLTQTKTYQVCSQIDGFPSYNFIDICALDISLSKSDIWIRSTLEALRSRCFYEIRANNTLLNALTNNGSTFKEFAKANLCPMSVNFEICSNNGHCENGVCSCSSNYVSKDCSVNISHPPVLSPLQHKELCDKTKEDCRIISVFGTIIHESANLTCRIQRFYKFANGSIEYDSVVNVVPARYMSLVEVDCSLPTAELYRYTMYVVTGFTVQISYNGILFSEQRLAQYEYDPSCQLPKGEENNRFFEIATNTCFIRGICYPHKFINPNNTFEECNSNESKLQWSFNATTTCKIDGQYIVKGNVSDKYQCKVCDPTQSSFTWTIPSNLCLISDVCYTLDELNSVDKDYFCNPMISQHEWTFNESVLIPHVQAKLVPVHLTTMNVNVERLHFVCSMNFSRLSYSFYEATWLWGENRISLNSTSKNLDDLDLTEDHFNSLGTHITCILKGKHSPNDDTGTTFRSLPFFAGVVVTDSINITKGATGNLQYQLTVPFGCLSYQGRRLPCFIELNMLSPENTDTDQCYGDIVNLQHCRVKIWRNAWNESRNLNIKHRGRQMYGVYPERIMLKLKTSSADHPLWDTTYIPEIKVYIHDKDVELQQRVCSAYNAHMSSFDGLHYENQYPGIFTMYKNKVKEKKIEVQVQLASCEGNGTIYCICGTAVRAGGDVYLIDFCEGHSLMQHISCQQKLLDIEVRSKDNKKYKVTFPTGTEVSIYIKYLAEKIFMNVEIRPSDDDFNTTEGLCGTLNDNCYDDFTKPDGQQILTDTCPNTRITLESRNFSNSWRVANAADLFHLKEGNLIDLWLEHDTYCSCPASEVSENFECSPRSTVLCNLKNEFKSIGQTTCSFYNKTEIEFVSVGNKTTDQLIPSVKEEEKITTSRIITTDDAFHYCREAIVNNTAFKACSVVPNMPVDYFIQICAIEVQISNSLEWIRHMTDSLKSRCLSEVQKNETLSTKPDDGMPSITETVIMTICPGLPECSGNGKCHDGLCVCNKEYMSDDCSMTKTQPPEILGIRGNGICDKNELSCDTAFIIGRRIEESDELSCRLTKYVIHSDGTRSFEGTTIQRGNVETLVEVHCPLNTPKRKRSIDSDNTPFVEVYDVSVGYNLANFSDAQRLYVVNRICMDINVTNKDHKFILKVNTCYIDGKCQMHEDRNPENPYLFCDASVSPYSWSFDEHKSCIVENQYYGEGQSKYKKECLLCKPVVTSYNWTLSQDFCFIDGECYKHEQKNSVDQCLVCNAKLDPYRWSTEQDVCITKVKNPTEKNEYSNKLGFLLLGSIGGVVLLFITGFIVNFYIKNKHLRQKQEKTGSTERLELKESRLRHRDRYSC